MKGAREVIENQAIMALQNIASIQMKTNHRFNEVLALFKNAMAARDQKILSGLVPKNNPVTVKDLLDLPPVARKSLFPGYALLAREASVVLLISSENPGVYLLLRFDHGEKTILKSLTVHSLGT